MTVQMVYYTITLTNPNSSVPASPDDGFIDPNKGTYYSELNGQDLETDWASSLENAQAKTRANIRWTQLLNNLGYYTVIEVIDMVSNNATATTEATTLSFDMAINSAQFESLATPDELNPGVYLYNTDCLARLCERALAGTFTSLETVYDPTIVTGEAGVVTGQTHRGDNVQWVIAGPVCASISAAASSVSITQLTPFTGN